MVTEQTFDDSTLSLERLVRLEGRALESRTNVTNRGRAALPLRWFAHPFFPWSEAGLELSLEADFAENPGFEWSPARRVVPKISHSWNRGQYLPIRTALGYELAVKQAHPKVGEVNIECRFPLG